VYKRQDRVLAVAGLPDVIEMRGKHDHLVPERRIPSLEHPLHVLCPTRGKERDEGTGRSVKGVDAVTGN
jgi:hypothetical protein